MTPLKHSLKRELLINGRPFVVTLSTESLKLTAKGRRNGLQLRWTDLVTGDAALSVALNASVTAFSSDVHGRPALPQSRSQQLAAVKKARAGRSRRFSETSG